MSGPAKAETELVAASSREVREDAASPLGNGVAGRAAALLANEWRAAALIFLVTRAIALAGAYSGVTRLIAAEPARNKGWLAELALMWDAAWYAGIARDHYQYGPAAPGGTSVAFAPLYPFLTSILAGALHAISFGWSWGNDKWGALIAAGLLISNVSFLVALVLLMKLVAPRIGRLGAVTVALALASFPTAFFFSALYTEGLFLLLVVSSVVLARSNLHAKWLCAGAIGMLAALDRFAGVLLLVVLLVEYLSQRGWRLKRVRWDLAWLALVPAGIGIYAVFLWWRFGSPLAFTDSQLKGWNHQASFFPATYWDSLLRLWQSLTGAVPAAQDPVLYYGGGSRLYAVLDLALPLLLILGGLMAWRKMLASEWSWLVLGVIYPLSTNITFSMARYVLPLWPGLIWLGALKGRRRWILLVWLLASIFLLAWCSRIYGGARWIG